MQFVLQIVAIAASGQTQQPFGWRVERTLGMVDCETTGEAVQRLDELEADLLNDRLQG